jgi:hypothetical protein
VAEQPTAVNTNPLKMGNLVVAIRSMLEPLATTKSALADGKSVDVFAVAVALKDQIAAGTLALSYGDYDGNDIEKIIAELLASA